MNNEQTIVIKLDADDIAKLNESMKKLIDELAYLRKRIERFDCEGMPEIRT